MREKLQKFLVLDPKDRYLLILAMAVQTGVQIGLWLLPFRVVLQILASSRFTGRSPSVKVGDYPEKCAWAIRVTSRYVPGSRCLCQALAGQFLMVRSGFFSEVRLGVTMAVSDFKAHAWLVWDGNILIGNLPDLCTFTPLPDLTGKTHKTSNLTAQRPL